jgi:hypothetical protein
MLSSFGLLERCRLPKVGAEHWLDTVLKGALGACRKVAILGTFAVLALETAVGRPLLRLLFTRIKLSSSESVVGRGRLGLAEDVGSGSSNLEGLAR